MLEIIGIIFAVLIVLFCLGVIFGKIIITPTDEVKKAWDEMKKNKESKVMFEALGWTFLILIALIAAGLSTGIVKIRKDGKPWPNRE